MTFTPSDSTDYATASSTVTVNVGKTTPTIGIGAISEVTLTYGTTLDNSQLSGTVTAVVNGKTVVVPGTLTYTSGAGTVIHSGSSGTHWGVVWHEAVDFHAQRHHGLRHGRRLRGSGRGPGDADGHLGWRGEPHLRHGAGQHAACGTASWTVNGVSVSVPGKFTYTSAAGTILSAGAGQTETVTFTPSDHTDYFAATSTVTVNVAQVTPTPVTVNAVNITYGTALANSQLTGTANWTVNGKPVSVPGTFTYTSAAGTVLKAGSSEQSEAVTFTPSDSTDYTTASSTVAVNVAKATPTVASVGAVNITYGTALANSQLSGTANWTAGGQSVSVPGTFSYTSAAGTVLKASSSGQSETVTFTPSDGTDYATASSTVTVNVGQATPTAVTVNPVKITYGTALANSQLSGTADWTVSGKSVSVPGTFTYTSAAGTVLTAGNGQSEAVTFTPSDTTDYTTAARTVTVNVGQATPKVVTVDPVAITYGTALANSQLSGTANWTVSGQSVSVPGTFSYTSAAGTVLKAGSSGQSEAVIFTPSDTHGLHHGQLYGDRHRGQGDADAGDGQSGEHHLRHGAGQFAAQRHGQLDGERPVGQRSGHVHLHVRRGHGVAGGQPGRPRR